MIFLDTNILLYACGLHGEDDPRTAKCREIVTANDRYAISVQVLQEFFDASTRPSRPRHLTIEEATSFTAVWRTFEVQPMTLAVFDGALEVRKKSNYRYWDCAIIAAALELGCNTVLSEDMQNERTFGRLRIVNPL